MSELSSASNNGPYSTQRPRDYTKLSQLTNEGRTLRDGGNPSHVHDLFNNWVERIAAWLLEECPESGLFLEWNGLGFSPLVRGNYYDDSDAAWHQFDQALGERLKWLGELSKRFVSLGTKAAEQTQLPKFIDPARIAELKRVKPKTFDYTKLLRLCEELNVCYAAECYLATSMITRSILDHVPPVFGYKHFREMANNYNGGKSFREAMQSLEESSRKIADQHLHSQIRSNEVLPNCTQVNFSQALDLLLAEIVRINKSHDECTLK